MRMLDMAGDACRYIQDPIHGTIAATTLECEVIDHPIVQRLRHIRQLGNASLVFPCATHSRFCHALGVMHQAGELFAAVTKSLTAGPERRLSGRLRRALAQTQQRVRLAGLLHDVGHGPFSHHFEHLLHESGATVSTLLGTPLAIPLSWIQLRSRAAYLEEPLRHEHFSVAAIAHLGLDEHLARSVISLIDTRFLCGPAMEEDLRCLCEAAGAPQSAWPSLLDCMRSLISSEIDADRMDYLRRDAYFCGVNVGFDAAHLVRSLSLVYHDKGFVIAIERNAVFALEQLLLARKQMFSQVYQNRANLLFDHLLQLAVRHIGHRGKIAVPRSVSDLLRLDDAFMVQTLRDHVVDHDISASPERIGDLALKMYLTRCLPVTLACHDIASGDWPKTERILRRRYPKADILLSPAKDLLGSHMTDESPSDGISGRKKTAGRPPKIGRIVTNQGLRGQLVPVAKASELVRSKAWRFSALRVVVTLPLAESAIKRELPEHLDLIVPDKPSPRRLRLVGNGSSGSSSSRAKQR